MPEESAIFTDRILEETAVSTYGLISNTEDGIQTQKTLLERYEMLVEELDARGIDALPSGCRIVETSDGHPSDGHPSDGHPKLWISVMITAFGSG